ncbi:MULTISPECIES: NirD/YgiW/YdeI family stress tolerance protein [unclassified Endozoicomonas]|uniref:NirD/YgiW/YdeI family stress tolerance protein n=1 Tax=unclassified Endozoicomonas TaxID=2644528 RepID=UPI0021487B68|nr:MULTISPECIES: NirD/YgiW/YdeI family stress tolerance protein [unclassified Endozoicomonas]
MKGLFFSGLCLLSLPAFSENDLPLPSPPASAQAHHYQKQSIDQVIENGDDEELVKLSGQIIKKLKCSIYLFRDKTGEIQIHIRNDDIPKKGLLFGSPTIIKGEVMKDPNEPIVVEADKILYVF